MLISVSFISVRNIPALVQRDGLGAKGERRGTGGKEGDTYAPVILL